jgi:hypothetical protein
MARPVKRSDASAGIAPELLDKIKGLARLTKDHIHAIRSGETAFYEQGQHEELCKLNALVYPALGIRPWDDDFAVIEAALKGAR